MKAFFDACALMPVRRDLITASLEGSSAFSKVDSTIFRR
jgi:hypothetical protein